MCELSVFFIMTGVLLAAAPISDRLSEQPSTDYRLLGEISNQPAAGWTHWWTGVGELADFTITNTTQQGYFGRKWNQYHPYYGTLTYQDEANQPDRNLDGNVGEYPVGSEQYYIFTSGAWFGALYPSEIDGADTTWAPNVYKGAYRCDLGAMSVPEMEDGGSMGDLRYLGLFMTTMRIPEDQELEGEGDLLFARPGQAPKSYQVLWPFADTMLNKNRPAGDKLDPSAGDWVSHEDSYAVGGDWIAEEFAAGLWLPYHPEDWPPEDSIRIYGLQPLGIRVEQRTYSWSRSALANAIVLNYKILNMNEYELKDPYFSYFMDNDIGHGGDSPGEDGGWDDKVGYDASHEVVYTYDANGSESGWSTAPGYIGCILLETPGDVGVTGCETWDNDTINHLDSEHYGDDLKYARMISTGFYTWNDPSDVRMLLNSGSYPDLAPDEEYDFTVAVVIGDNLNNLYSNIDAFRAAFSEGFPWVGIEEPEAPTPSEPIKLSLTTANISNDLIGLRYSLPRASNIDISVFDAAGRKVQALKQGYTPAGSGEITWNTSRAPAGVYFIRLSADNKYLTERVLIVR
jgi:hypothetical protein